MTLYCMATCVLTLFIYRVFTQKLRRPKRSITLGLDVESAIFETIITIDSEVWVWLTYDLNKY